jgi:hypothetical protein
MTKIKKKLSNEPQPAIAKPIVIGSFSDKSKLEYLIKKWEVDADTIKAMVDDVNNGKKPRETYNHFLIQLLKCIGDAKVALKNWL